MKKLHVKCSTSAYVLVIRVIHAVMLHVESIVNSAGAERTGSKWVGLCGIPAAEVGGVKGTSGLASTSDG